MRTRILIIDDEPDITLTFRKALTDKGFDQVETANDPVLDVKNFKAGSYDLLIIDIVMSQMDGFSLYENIRKIDNKVKVCFITAFEINYQALESCISCCHYRYLNINKHRMNNRCPTNLSRGLPAKQYIRILMR